MHLKAKKRGPGRPRTKAEPEKWFTSEVTVEQLEGIEAALQDVEPSLPPSVLGKLAIAALGYPVLADLKGNAPRKGCSKGRRPAIQDAKLLAQFAEILARAKGTNANKLLRQVNGYWEMYKPKGGNGKILPRGGKRPVLERLVRRALLELRKPHVHSLRQQARAAKKHFS